MEIPADLNQTLAYLGLQLCFAYAPITYTRQTIKGDFYLLTNAADQHY